MKKFLLFGLLVAMLPAVAEEAADRKTATSLKYVTHELDTRQNKFGADTNKAMEYTDSAGTVQKRAVKSDLGTSTSDTSLPMVGGVNTKLNQKQDDIDPFNDHTAVTYTGTAGGIGKKGIYQTTGTYAEQSDNLIDAKTFNAALKNGLDSEFVCREDNRDPVSGLCWLYTIHNGTAGNSLPDGYTELEYLIFDGQSYFDTGIVLRDIHNIENVIEMQNANPDSNAFQTWTGFMYQSTTPRYGINTYSGRWMIGVNITINSGLPQDGNKHTLRFVTTDGTQTLYDTNGSVLSNGSLTGSFASNALSLYIGARNQGSSVTNYVIGNIGRTWLSQNGTKLYDYIPVRNGAGDLGMYDMVSRTFKPNAGQGTLTAGPEVGTSNIYIPQNQ